MKIILEGLLVTMLFVFLAFFGDTAETKQTQIPAPTVAVRG